jgi:multiple sugar transport system substrate-binding protein
VPGKGTFVKKMPNTLQFANWLSSEEVTREVLETTIAEFNRKSDTGGIEALGIPYSEMERRLEIMTGGGEAPDIASLVYLWTPLLAYKGALEPLEDLYRGSFEDDFFPGAADSTRYNNHYYGVNWISAPVILYFRRDVAERFGFENILSADYYDELTDIFQDIHTKSKGSVIPFSIPILDDELFFLFSLTPFLLSFGGGIFDERGEIILNAGKNIEAFRWLKNFIENGHVNLTNEYRKNRQLFAEGKLAFIMEGPWMRSMIPAYSGSPAEWSEHTGYRTLLKTPNGRSASVLWNHTLSIFRQCKDKKLAAEFLKYLTLDPQVASRYYRRTGMLPARKSQIRNSLVFNDDFGRILQQQMETASPIQVLDPPSFILSITICAKAAREILLGEADIAATLNSHAEIIRTVQKAGLKQQKIHT